MILLDIGPYQVMKVKLARYKNAQPNVESHRSHQASSSRYVSSGATRDSTHYRLSAEERKLIAKINDPMLTAAMMTGDKAGAKGDLVAEAEAHKKIQMELRGAYELDGKRDPETHDAFKGNSAIISKKDAVVEALKGGASAKFEDLFVLDPTTGRYELRSPKT